MCCVNTIDGVVQLYVFNLTVCELFLSLKGKPSKKNWKSSACYNQTFNANNSLMNADAWFVP